MLVGLRWMDDARWITFATEPRESVAETPERYLLVWISLPD
jgi:hypothetical protein